MFFIKSHHFVLVLAAVVAFAVIMPGAPGAARAGQEASVQGFRDADALPLPRFVSLRSDKVYVRAGPALRYPIKWIYKRAGMPVEITREFESWRKIRDFDGEEGWIHMSLLSGERAAIVHKSDDPVPMRESSKPEARMIARLEPEVIARVDRCAGDWCRVEAGGYRGWVERNFLWGIYEDEELN